MTACCGKCLSYDNLFVWSIPDPYNGYPILPEIICIDCPEPINIFKSDKSKYSIDFHDEIFGFKDYSVGLSRMYNGENDIHGICFECDKDVNMSKGYGSCYVPEKYEKDGYGSYNVIYCENCYRIRCKNHINFKQESELIKLDLKLDNYMKKTDEGIIK